MSLHPELPEESETRIEDEVITPEALEEGLLAFFGANPNTSPLVVTENPNFPPGLIAAYLCVLRESGKLITTGRDENGVLLSIAGGDSQ